MLRDAHRQTPAKHAPSRRPLHVIYIELNARSRCCWCTTICEILVRRVYSVAPYPVFCTLAGPVFFCKYDYVTDAVRPSQRSSFPPKIVRCSFDKAKNDNFIRTPPPTTNVAEALHCTASVCAPDLFVLEIVCFLVRTHGMRCDVCVCLCL